MNYYGTNCYGLIYYLINKITSKVYIGQTINLKNRMRQHSIAKTDDKLHNAIRKYGWENFQQIDLDIARNKEELDALERFYIEKFQSIEFGYNIRGGGAKGEFGLESRNKLREGKLGDKNPMYGKKGEANPNYGKKASPEARKKQSISRTGKKLSLETKNKQSLSHKGQFAGSKNPMYGKTGDKCPNYGRGRKVICNETGQIFTNIPRTAEHFGGSAGNLNKHLRNDTYKSFKGYTFSYYDEEKEIKG